MTSKELIAEARDMIEKVAAFHVALGVEGLMGDSEKRSELQIITELTDALEEAADKQRQMLAAATRIREVGPFSSVDAYDDGYKQAAFDIIDRLEDIADSEWSASDEENKLAIISYIREHAGRDASDAAKALGIDNYTAYRLTHELAKEGRIVPDDEKPRR